MIDDHSGLMFSIFAGSTQQDADWQARAVAEEMGNNIITVTDTSEWRELRTQSIHMGCGHECTGQRRSGIDRRSTRIDG